MSKYFTSVARDLLYDDLTDAQAIAQALESVAHQLCLLGNAGAIHPNGGEVGAIENLAMEIRDGSQEIASGLHAIADAIRERGIND